MRRFTAEDALHRTFNQPLEVSERAGDGTLAPAVAVLAGAVIRDETDLHSALTIAFAAGVHYAPKGVVLRFDGPISDEIVERAGAVLLAQNKGLRWNEASLPTRLSYATLAHGILEAALNPAAHPPADDGAGGSS